jgi:hypothetical protein
MRSLGTKNEKAAQWLLDMLFNAAAPTTVSKSTIEGELNGALSLLQEIAPRDEIEAMLVSQMIVTHLMVAKQARRLHSATTIPQLEANGSLLTKLQRTFIAQLEALQRYRGKAPQQVRVEHVHIHEGGHAIVGAIHAGVGVPTKSEDRPHAKAVTDAFGEAVQSDVEEVRDAMPVARG